MAFYWWIPILACVSCCILCWADEHDEQMISDASATPSEGSIRGFRPCLDESCSAESLDSEDDGTLSWHVLSAVVRAHKRIYQISDSVSGDSDVTVQHCIPLHQRTVDRISSIEERHPDIKDMKMKVIEDFIRFVSDFAILNTTGCDTPMNLIGFMSLAVRSLEVEYSQHCGETCNCVYTAGVEEYMASTSTTESLPTSTTMTQSTTESMPLGDEGYRTPCPEESDHDSYEETYAEDQHHSYGSSMLVGSIRGVPGVNFPNYTDIPLTSFSCADKKYIPGFYADLETDCQVFHVCYEHRRESFLCPLGTVFNQPILACDYWYSSNCSHAKDYYEVNIKSEEEVKEEAIKVIKEIIEEEETEVTEEHSESTDEVYEEVGSKQVVEEHSESTDEVQAEVDIRQFLPVKAKVIDFEKPVVKGKESVMVEKQAAQEVKEVASEIFTKIVSTASDVVSAARVVIDGVPEPESKLEPSSLDFGKVKPILSPKKVSGMKFAAAIPAAKIAIKSAVPVAKFVVAKKIIPLAAKAAVAPIKLAAVKTAIPVVAAKAVPLASKAAVAAAVPAAKIVAAKTAVPIAAKVAAVKTAIPVAAKVAAVKTAIPVAAKVAAVKTAVPVAVKASTVKAAIPVAVKAKLLAVPAKKVAVSGVKVAAAVPKLAVPVLKAKKLAPVVKGKVLKAAAIPVLKAKILPVKSSLAGLAPVAKAKMVKAAAISPLTKKTLALGYMKLLKAKKLALMG